MRRILIEHARKRERVKLGGHLTHLSLDAPELAVGENSESFLVLDNAIRRLSEQPNGPPKWSDEPVSHGFSLELCDSIKEAIIRQP